MDLSPFWQFQKQKLRNYIATTVVNGMFTVKLQNTRVALVLWQRSKSGDGIILLGGKICGWITKTSGFNMGLLVMTLS